MEITFRMSYRRNFIYSAKCDQTTVDEGKEVGGHPHHQGFFCVQGCPSNLLVSLIRYVCTDYSFSGNWEYGQRTLRFSFPNATRITLSAKGCCWVSPYLSSSWDIFTSIDLTVRQDTGKINSSPQARFLPVIQIQEGCNSSIAIAPYDPDGDVVRCRWGNATTGECSGICNGFPGAILDEQTCSLLYRSTGGDVGFKAVAIIMEDFSVSDTAYNLPLSTVALNFLVNVYSFGLNCSAGVPEFIKPTPPHMACIAIPRGMQYDGRIVIDTNSPTAAITEVQTVGPVGLMRSAVTAIPLTTQTYMNVTWLPGESDYFENNNNVESMCFTGLSSTRQSTEQRCISWMAGVLPPQVISGSTKPRNMKVNPINPVFEVRFNQDIVRSIHPSRFVIRDTLRNEEVYSITVNGQEGIESIQFLDDENVTISTNFRFEEKRNFSVSLESGFVKGTTGCGPQNEEYPANDLWSFETMDITPPRILFMQAPRRSNGTIKFEWRITEPVQNVSCLITRGRSRVEFWKGDCFNNVWEGASLEPGIYFITVLATDTAGNIGSKEGTWFVDITPPQVIIRAPFSGNMSNRMSALFNFECPEKPWCTYRCFSGKGDAVASVICQQGFHLAIGVDTEGLYQLIVSAIDDLGNIGNNFTFTWIADFTKPVISNIVTVSVNCTGDVATENIALPTVIDNFDNNPTLVFMDQGTLGMCQMVRIWTAEDAAGNQMMSEQTIISTYSPVINLLEQVRFPCDPNESPTVPTQTANIDNVCSRNVTLTYTDSVQSPTCPDQITRTWTARDTCDQSSSLVIKTQLIVLYSICPPSACGRNNQPPQGRCIEGNCFCISPWDGENCNITILEPLIKDMSQPEVLQEGQEYTSSLEILEGTVPIYWELDQGPEGMTVNPQTGVVKWQAYTIGLIQTSVKVTNQVGMDITSWNMTVMPGYKTTLDPLQQTNFSRAASILLSGSVIFEIDNVIEAISSGQVPVDVLIIFDGTTRKYQTVTEPDKTFEVLFEPLPSEYGVYDATSKHPGVLESQAMVEWKVLGMRFETPVASISDETLSNVDMRYTNVSKLINDGPGALTDIKVVSTLNVPNDIQMEIVFGSTTSVSILEPGTEIPISVSIKAPQAFGKVRAFFTLKSAEDVVATFVLDTEISFARPAFEIDPRSLNEVITRGSQKTVQFNITNVGRAIAFETFVSVPRVTYLSVVTFGSSSYADEKQNISIGQSLLLTLQISASSDSSIGWFEGAMVVSSNEAVKRIQINLKIISGVNSTVSFRIEDEFTYFKDGNPLVENADIRIYNRLRGLTLIQNSEAGQGIASFENVPAETYEVQVNAPRHEGVKAVYTFQPGSSTIRIFLKRTAVTYRWTVTPTQVEDIYRIDVEADFETRVPMPVVTVTPTSIDLEPFELGLRNSFQLNVTNHGLIRAERFAFAFPTNHPILEFQMLAGFDTLDARTSKIVPVRVVRKIGGRRRRATCGGQEIKIQFSYMCGNWIIRNITIRFVVPVHQCPEGLISNSGGYNGAGYISMCCGVPVSGRAFCNPCLQAFIDTILFFTPIPKVECTFGGFTSFLGDPTHEDNIRSVKCGTVYALGLGASVATSVPPVRTAASAIKIGVLLYKIIVSVDALNKFCNVTEQGPRVKREVRDQLIRNYALAAKPFNALLEWKLELFGKQVWLAVDEEAWMTAAFFPTISDQSDQGQAISQQELGTITSMTPPVGVTRQDVIDFVNRWNNTVYDWNRGKTEPDGNNPNRMSFSKIKRYKQEVRTSNQDAVGAGYDSFVEQYNDRIEALNEITNWEEEVGVCAVVRVRIEQELALTREGFTAKLGIDNGEISTLKKIDVTIEIKDAENGEESTSLFSIGNATLGGAIKADRSLAMQQQGELSWLMIPYSEAAPNDDKYYDVGGTLFYEVDGALIPVPLFPARIRVKPDPLLYVHYFWEKFVISDDPFTDEVERAVPFSLGVVVKNAGNGTANNLRIMSSQPEIIDNEKGLLVNFKMIGASIGNMNVTPSLSVNFGDVGPDMTVVASWWMVSSLKGKFQNYSATFENENPLGDPRLSLLDELEVHELIHRVRILEAGMDDGIDDFLVNEKIDFNIYPDLVFSSKTLEKYDVLLQNISLIGTNYHSLSYTFSLQANPVSQGYVYYRFDTMIPTSEQVSLDSSSFSRTVLTSTTLPPQNAWLTSMIGERTSDTITGHIFDYIQDVGTLHQYEVIFSSMFKENTFELRPTDPPVEVTLQPLETTATTSMTTPLGPTPEDTTVKPPLVTTTVTTTKKPPTSTTTTMPNQSQGNRDIANKIAVFSAGIAMFIFVWIF